MTKKNQKSEQYMIAHEEQIERDPVDLDARFKRIDDPATLAEFARIRAESEARMQQIDEETQAFIQAEKAKGSLGQKKSEQYNIASLEDLSSGGKR